MKLQHDHENMAALLDLMLATNKASDARSRAQQALDWLTMREGVMGSGIWLVQSGDLVCLARRNIDLRAVVPTIQKVIAASTPMPLTSAYQQDLHLTILPLGIANHHYGALAVITQAPPDLGEFLLQQAIAAYLTATITRPAVSQVAETSERDWEEFLAHAVHEIKNPLASIKGYADLLLRRAAKDPADPYRKGLSTISVQVGRTTDLLDQLADVTRLGTGRFPIDRHAADFTHIVDQVVQAYQAADQQHMITLEGADTALPGHFDQGRIARWLARLSAMRSNFRSMVGWSACCCGDHAPIMEQPWRSSRSAIQVLAFPRVSRSAFSSASFGVAIFVQPMRA